MTTADMKNAGQAARARKTPASVLLLLLARNVLALSGGDTVVADVVLDKDLTTWWNYGLSVGADNITIDGKGYSLTYIGHRGSFITEGIRLYGHTNVTIRNFGQISGFDTGIRVFGGENNTIENCRIEGNILAGVWAANAETLTLANNVIRETHTAVDFLLNNTATSRMIGNTLLGGRMAVRGTVGTFAGNTLLHQAQSALEGNRRLFRFANVSRTGQPGQPIAFDFNMYLIDNSASSTSTYTVRTVPPTPVSSSRSGNTVTGHFTPSRPGLHALVVEVTDPNGNTEKRTAQFLVGPTAVRSLRYYWTHNYPQHGQTSRTGFDTGGMFLDLPTENSFRRCGGWVQVSPDELPSLPAAIIRNIDCNLLLKFEPGPNDAVLGIQRDATFGVAIDRSADVPNSWGGEGLQWAEFTIGNVNWTLDYPIEWLYLSAKFIANDPWVETGNPEQPSHTVFHYETTVSPEVCSVVGDSMLLLLSATADSVACGGEELTVWGANDQADLTLANFRRPFNTAPTRINAAGETVFNTGMVNGEKTFAAMPLDVVPAADAVNVSVGVWNGEGDGRREWTVMSVGAPGSVGHTVHGLEPGQPYRARANGQPLAVLTASGFGQIQFDYAGGFPVTLEIEPVSTVAIAKPADGARFPEPATLDIEAAVSGTLGALARVEFFCGETKLGKATANPYRIAWAEAPAGNHPLTAVAVSTDGIAYTSAVVRIAVVAPHIILASAGPGGTIQPEGAVETPDGADRTFVIAPEIGHVVRDVRVDGIPIGPETDYTFLSVTNAHSIKAFFHKVRFEGLAVHPANGQWVLSFESLSNRWYEALYKDDLLDTNNWQVLSGNPVAGTGHLMEIADPDPPARRFYRLRLIE